VFIGERLEGFKNGRLGLAFLNFVMVKRTLSRDGIYCYDTGMIILLYGACKFFILLNFYLMNFLLRVVLKRPTDMLVVMIDVVFTKAQTALPVRLALRAVGVRCLEL